MRPLDAYESVMRFAAERGEAALRLALHAAVPQSFRPELLHLLRLNFVPEAAWENEADVLLAPFCEDVGSGYYQLDAEVRRLLLDQLDPTYPEEEGNRIRRVADFLIAYLGSGRRSFGEADRVDRDFVSIEGWVALSFFDPEAAALQLAAALDQDAQAGAATRLQFGGLASALAVPLARYSRLLSYAAGVEALQEGRIGEAVEILERLPDEEVEVGGVRLRSPRRLITSRQDSGRAREVPQQDGSAGRRQQEVYLSYSHHDRPWVDRLRAHLELLQTAETFEVWSSRLDIDMGAEWLEELRDRILRARVAVLFVSPFFLSSPFLIEKELPSILAQKEHGLSVVPLLVSTSVWREVGGLTSSTVWPRNGRPLDQLTQPRIETELAALASEIVRMVRPTRAEPSRPQPPRVFLSYSHDSEEHVRQAHRLVGRLWDDGIDCAIDQYMPMPTASGAEWMASEIEGADFVLVVLGQGRLAFESVLLDHRARRPDRFIPILFEDLPEPSVPAAFRGLTRYRVYRKSGYRSLLRRLTRQPDESVANETPEPGAWTPEQQEVVDDLRNVGTGMFVWYKDTEIQLRDRRGDENVESTIVVDVSQVPIFSHAALESLLVPRYLKALPKTDPWGHDYEFRLNTEDPGAAHVMVVRSSGADGRFSGNVYEVGDFPPAETAQDLVWADGYFVRWPERAESRAGWRPRPFGEGAQHW
jgi:hypothetical protein